MNSRNTTVTNTAWGVSQTSTCGVEGATLNIYHHVRGKDGRTLWRNGDLNELKGNKDELWARALEHGYLKRYGRNTCGFVMSRAARRRGLKTDNGMYNRAHERTGAKPLHVWADVPSKWCGKPYRVKFHVADDADLQQQIEWMSR